MIVGLEPLYGPQPWAPQHPKGLCNDVVAGFTFNPAFGGAMEVEAAEALYDVVREQAKTTLSRGGIYTAVETGTCDSFSSMFIARAIIDATRAVQGRIGNGGLFTFEIDRLRSDGLERPWPKIWHDLGLASHITGVFGDTRQEQTYRDAGVFEYPIDLILLDSEHTDTTILAEWRVLREHLSPDAIVLMHDTDLTLVAKARDAIAAELGSPITALKSCRGFSLMRKQ